MIKDTLDDLSSLVGEDATGKSQRLALEESVQRHSTRIFLFASTLISAVTGTLLWLTIGSNEPLGGLPPPLLAWGICALSAVAIWHGPARHGKSLALLIMSLSIGLAAAIAVSRQFGFQAGSLGAMGLMVALSTAVHGTRHGLVLFGLGVLALCGVGWAELEGMGRPVLSPDHRIFGPAITQFMLLVIGLIVGLGTRRMLRRSLGEAAERNARFRHLLGMAADWYWEMDREFRFTHVAEDQPGASGLDLQTRLGKTPWDIEQLGLSDDDLDAHRADLESHRPFHGLVARRRARTAAHAMSRSAASPASTRKAISAATGASVAMSPPKCRPSRPWPLPKPATANCSAARPARWCCTAGAACSMPTRRRWPCSATRSAPA